MEIRFLSSFQFQISTLWVHPSKSDPEILLFQACNLIEPSLVSIP